MLTGLSVIFLFGMFMGWIFRKISLPPLIGMMVSGIIAGPYVLNIIDPVTLSISDSLRKIALIIILSRAGLSLDIDSLKKAGRSAIMLCFVPAAFEMAACTIAGHFILGLSYIEAAVAGSVLAAVSPAVVVPRMIKLIDEGYGSKKGIPQMIMTGASVDDVFVIVMFTSFSALAAGESVSLTSFINIPVSIIAGIIIGIASGLGLKKLFAFSSMSPASKTIVFLGLAFLLTSLETALENILPFASLLSIMTSGAVIYRMRKKDAEEMSLKFSQLWIGAELMLFVLVGALIDIKYALAAGLGVIAVIAICLLIRMAGVQACLIKTPFNRKERLFTSISYSPKATVQAAIGSVPLSMGLSCGKTVLTIAVAAIIITAPIGALAIDRTYKRLLKKD